MESTIFLTIILVREITKKIQIIIHDEWILQSIKSTLTSISYQASNIAVYHL